MQKLLVAVTVAMALVATSCGGSATVQDAPTAVGSSDESAARLIGQLGSDAAAADALIIAMDRGYSGPQILAAVDNNGLQADGTIKDQEPTRPALDLVLYSLDGEDEGALAPPTGSSEWGEVTLASFSQVQRTPIERLREHGTRALGVGEPATEQILQLLKAGFLPADIIEVLIFGIDGTTDYPEEPDGPVACLEIVDEIYCPFGERFPMPTESQPETEAPDEPQEAPAAAEAPTGPVTFSGSASQGAIENENSDDLRSAEFTATIDGSTVILRATVTTHRWLRGGYEEVYVDQNCGATYRHVLRFEGPTGNPTELRSIVEASEILEVQGVLCDDDDTLRGLLTVGDSKGRFQGQANGLGIEGTLDFVSLPLEISARG